jgi:hypothetical protein
MRTGMDFLAIGDFLVSRVSIGRTPSVDLTEEKC